jgi:hypothetical protein
MLCIIPHHELVSVALIWSLAVAAMDADWRALASARRKTKTPPQKEAKKHERTCTVFFY